MNQSLSITEITARLTKAEQDLTVFCCAVSDEQFFRQPEGKWSPAQQVKHLISATNTARLAFSLPKFMVRLVGGKPNRASRTYDDLVAKYKQKLEQGGKASGRYIPKPVLASYGRDRLLGEFQKAMHQFADTLQKNWKDSQPDQYIAPHPLLGRITLQELCYFTIYHTCHHLGSIRNLATS